MRKDSNTKSICERTLIYNMYGKDKEYTTCTEKIRNVQHVRDSNPQPSD